MSIQNSALDTTSCDLVLDTNADPSSRIEGINITVVLDGVVYDAVVPAETWTPNIAFAFPAQVLLSDGDYTIAAYSEDIGVSRLLRGSSGNEEATQATTAGCYAAELSDGKVLLRLGHVRQPDLTSSLLSENLLGETGHKWVAHSEPTLRPKVMTLRSTAGCIRIPSSLVLTPKVIVSACEKMPSAKVGQVIENLIDMMNERQGDVEQELDADVEPEDY